MGLSETILVRKPEKDGDVKCYLEKRGVTALGIFDATMDREHAKRFSSAFMAAAYMIDHDLSPKSWYWEPFAGGET